MASESGYTSEQVRQLEELFVECKFPNREQREKWSEDLDMDPDQIKFWFKNKVLLLQIEEKRQENIALRIENAKIQLENLMISKLKDRPKCSTCSRGEVVEDLLRENARLKEEHRRVTNIAVANAMLSSPELLQGQDTSKEVDTELRLAPAFSPSYFN